MNFKELVLMIMRLFGVWIEDLFCFICIFLSTNESTAFSAVLVVDAVFQAPDPLGR